MKEILLFLYLNLFSSPGEENNLFTIFLGLWGRQGQKLFLSGMLPYLDYDFFFFWQDTFIAPLIGTMK